MSNVHNLKILLGPTKAWLAVYKNLEWQYL